jgi:hypothetical protein
MRLADLRHWDEPHTDVALEPSQQALAMHYLAVFLQSNHGLSLLALK